jgi:hypothetical protein
MRRSLRQISSHYASIQSASRDSVALWSTASHGNYDPAQRSTPKSLCSRPEKRPDKYPQHLLPEGQLSGTSLRPTEYTGAEISARPYFLRS